MLRVGRETSFHYAVTFVSHHQFNSMMFVHQHVIIAQLVRYTSHSLSKTELHTRKKGKIIVIFLMSTRTNDLIDYNSHACVRQVFQNETFFIRNVTVGRLHTCKIFFFFCTCKSETCFIRCVTNSRLCVREWLSAVDVSESYNTIRIQCVLVLSINLFWLIVLNSYDPKKI